MKEEDLALAQALVAASAAAPHSTIKKTLITQIQQKTKAFR